MNLRARSWDHADCSRGRDRYVVNWFFCRPNILNFSSWWWTDEIRISRGVITRKYSETLRPSAHLLPGYLIIEHNYAVNVHVKSFRFNIAFKIFWDWEGVLVALHASLIRAQCFYYSPAHFLLVNTINKNQITILIWCGCWCWLLVLAGQWWPGNFSILYFHDSRVERW